MTQYNITSFSFFVALILKTLLDDKFTLHRYKEWYKNIQAIAQALSKTNPVKIYLDEHLAHYYPIFRSRCPNAEIELVNTKLSTKKYKGYPPLNSSFSPSKGIISNIICEMLWGRHFVTLRINSFLQRISLLYLDEDYFINRYLNVANLKLKDFMSYNCSFYKSIKNVKINILAPVKLEFPNKGISSFEKYIDLPIQRTEQHLLNAEYYLLLIRLIQDRKNGAKIIYCSFGTLSLLNKGTISKFVDKLVALLREEKSWRLVITVNLNEIIKCDNIFTLRVVPQLHLLPHCDLMITHGGLTTVKECLQFNIPMLAYPINQHYDQNGNAIRINYHGYGLMGDIKHDSKDLIRHKIILLTDNIKGVAINGVGDT